MSTRHVAGDTGQRGHVSPEDTASLARTAPVAHPSLQPVLLVLHGCAEPTASPIAGARTIGRDDGCDVVLDDSAVSRTHARVSPIGDGRVEVVDLASRNGTAVDGRRIRRAVVDGAILRIGSTLLRIGAFSEQFRPATPEGPLVGGTSLATVRRTIRLVGPTPLPVRIGGETGTGKEIVARLVHEASGRLGPFIAVNCAALPETLVESELFGHARGAFTGATRGRKGLFAAADGGTLFLDEIGEFPLETQAKLLRVLEEGTVRPVGGERADKVDVRVVCASNRDLDAAAAEGRFRADLLARLSGVAIDLPALRERPEDLPALARYLLQRAGAGTRTIEADALEALLLYSWPMNVRELESVLRTASLAGTDTIRRSDLPERIRAAAQADEETHETHEGDDAARRMADQRQRVEDALREQGGNVRRAAKQAGFARSHMYRLLKRWNLDPDAFRGN